MFNISGHNVNFVCGLVDESIDHVAAVFEQLSQFCKKWQIRR